MNMLSVVNRIEGKVLALIAEKFSARDQMLTRRTDFRRDLGADSLAMVEKSRPDGSVERTALGMG